MWELDCEEGWALKNWCFWTVVLEKTFESPLESKEIQPVHPKGNKSWIFFGRTDAKAETTIFWPPDAKHWLIGKDPDAGRDWRWEEKGMTEDEMVWWHHRLDGHEFDQALGVGDGQGSLACCSTWSCKELDRHEWLNWTLLWENTCCGLNCGKVMWTLWERGVCKPGSGSSLEPDHAGTLKSDFSLQSCEKVSFCCLSHSMLIAIAIIHTDTPVPNTFTGYVALHNFKILLLSKAFKWIDTLTHFTFNKF